MAVGGRVQWCGGGSCWAEPQVVYLFLLRFISGKTASLCASKNELGFLLCWGIAISLDLPGINNYTVN